MAVSIPDVKFELRKVYKTYADQIMLAGGISDILLDNSDIHAAGGQVEGSLRLLLNELLPERVKVTHGHIVDKFANISYQQDILIAESFFTRSLIKTLDGTEFYPFESIFSTGEVKKRWSAKNLKDAIKSIERNKKVLERYHVPPDVLATGSNFIKVAASLTKNSYRNPLFSFSFSLSHDKTYTPSSIAKIYKDIDVWKFLPSISVVLDRGIYVLLNNDMLEKGKLHVKLYPEFVKQEDNCQWYFINLDPEECLSYLVFMLIQHINDTVLEKASTIVYSESMLDIPLQKISVLE